MSDANPQKSEAEEYPVAPLPQDWQSATSPAYRREEAGNVEEYPLGPEVDEEKFPVGTQNWREAAAGVHRDIDEFGIGPAADVPRRKFIESVKRRAERQLAVLRDDRIGTLDDPTRFSLGGLLLVTAAASVVLAFGSRLPRGAFAGVCGAGAVLTLLLSKWIRQGSAVLTAAWWTLMAIYLLASLFAMFGL